MSAIKWKPTDGGPLSFVPVDLKAMHERIVSAIIAEEYDGDEVPAEARTAIEWRATLRIKNWLAEKRDAIEAVIRANEVTP